MSSREHTRSEDVTLLQKVVEYVMIGLFASVVGIYGLAHHPILFEVGILAGAGIGLVIILVINYFVPWFNLN